MIRKTISMPEEMGAWIGQRIKSGQYNNDSEYIRDLIRHDQKQQDAAEKLAQLLEEGEQSGISEYTVPEIMKQVEDRMRKSGQLPTDTESR